MRSKGSSHAISCLVGHLSIQGQIPAQHQVPPPSPSGVALSGEPPSSSQRELGGVSKWKRAGVTAAARGVDGACEALWSGQGSGSRLYPATPTAFALKKLKQAQAECHVPALQLGG